MDAGDEAVLAEHEFAAAAGLAMAAMAAVPADADALAGLPVGDFGAQDIDHADDLVSGYARIGHDRPVPFLDD